MAPWAQWKVDERRERRNDRKALVAAWRAGLTEDTTDWHTRPALDHAALVQTQWYTSLRPHLSADARARLEPPPRTFVVGPDGVRDWLATTILDEIDRVERAWGLP